MQSWIRNKSGNSFSATTDKESLTEYNTHEFMKKNSTQHCNEAETKIQRFWT